MDPPDQTVRVVARRNTPLKVLVDKELVFDGRLAGGDDREFIGRERVAVELPATSAVRIEYNGRSIVPQGHQDAPRRLVFVDDMGSP